MSDIPPNKDMGKFLTPMPELSREFSKIANADVKIYFDRAIQMYLLRYKGKDCMWLKKNLANERDKVRKHFVRLRNGEKPRDKYADEWKKNDEYMRDRERRWNEAVEYRSKEDASMIFYYLFNGGRRHVVIDGGKRNE